MGLKEEHMSSKKKYRENFKKAVKMEIREHKSSFAVYMIIRSIVFLVMIRQAFNGNYENVFMCILTLLLLTVPSFIQVRFRIELPKTLEIIILLFIFSAEILGEVNEFYLKIPYWDSNPAYIERFSGGGHRLFACRSFKQRRQARVQSFAVFCRCRSFLFLDDHRRALGVL